MSTETNPIVGAYLVKGTIGNCGMPGAPIVHFALVVTPFNHQVTGTVQITQATQNGNYSGQVHGTLYSTGYGSVTQVVALTGSVHSDGTTPIEMAFGAHLSINADWSGTGGFQYANVHVADVPVQRLVQ